MTPERYRRLREVLERRQPDLTVLLENVHKPHNFAAVVRSCDAVGVAEAHAVYPDGRLPVARRAAQGSQRWVRVHSHGHLEEALAALAGGGFRLVAADPTPEATDYRRVDYTRPTAVLLGQEKDGLTDAARAAADELISIPMVGASASLNVSVAAALILFEAQRQRLEAGMYETSRLDPETLERRMFEWAYPRLAALCRRKRAPYPRLAEDGEILDPVPR